jgi:branched-chain amino acid transport system permease protein
MVEYGLAILAFWGVFGIGSSVVAYLEDQAGIVHVAAGAVVCYGSYVAAILVAHYRFSPWLATGVALVAGMLFGVVLHLITLRMAKDSLSLATLGLAVIVHGLALNLTRLTGGPMGIAGLPSWRPILWHPAADLIILLILVAVAIRWLPLTVFGKRVCALRDDEDLARDLGLDPKGIRLRLWVLSSCALAGTGGIYAFLLRFVDPSSFSLHLSIDILAMAFAIRLPLPWRGAVGSFVFLVLPEVLRYLSVAPALASQLRQLFFAMALMWITSRVFRGRRRQDGAEAI